MGEDEDGGSARKVKKGKGEENMRAEKGAGRGKRNKGKERARNADV